MFLVGRYRKNLADVLHVCLFGAVATGCGSRTSVPYGDGTFESPCVVSADCTSENRCETRACVSGYCQIIAKTQCDDADECTTDSCDPSTGACEYLPRTSDEDGDGHRAYLLGTRLGEPGSCGDDCDDTSAQSHPGGTESCDGVDNDCNGVIDDRAGVGAPTAPVLVSYTSENESLPAGLTYALGNFAMTTVQRDESWRGYFQSVDVNGVPVVEPVSLTSDASDGMAGPLVWTGALFGTAWEDRRERSYDIYFNRLDIAGKKLGPDVRVTATKGFSVGPSLLWDGSTWILAYSEESETGIFRIFARRLNYDGSNTGEAIPVTDRFLDARGARLLRTQSGLSLFYTAARKGFQYLRLGVDLTPLAAPVVLPLENAGEVAVRWNRDRFFVAWSVKTKTFGSDIWTMSIDEQGRTLAVPRRLVGGSSTARSPAWVTYGDRAYLIWADDYDLEGTVELSGQMFDRDFLPLSARQRLTWLFAETFDPAATIGGSSIGILFRSRALGSWQSFFLGLQCVEGLK